MNLLTRLLRRRTIKNHPIPHAAWRDVLSLVPTLQGMSPDDRKRLHDWVILFLLAKHITGARGWALTDAMRLTIAAEACLLILNLDLDDYQGWRQVIVYPETFVVGRDEEDGAGVVHFRQTALAGESWHQGPVIISWEDARPDSPARKEGASVIIHEFAHKLDMCNGAANGMPPLHRGMNRQRWTDAFAESYVALKEDLEMGRATAINSYAASSPAEFFAVMSEAFFVTPHLVTRYFPQIYNQLAQYYRQDPADRDANATGMA